MSKKQPLVQAVSTMSSKQKLYLASLEGWVSIVVNLLLFGFKFWAGTVTGSVAIVADAWHTLSDSFTSVVVIAGSQAARKPPDEEHPFGHGRFELIGALVIGLLLMLVAFGFVREGIARLGKHTPVQFNHFALIITAVSVIVKEVMARFSYWAGKRTGLQSLKADGWHHRSDAITSAVILIGVAAGSRFWWLDSVLGIIVAVLILYAAWEILRDTINPLLGESPDPALLGKMIAIARETSGRPLDVHHVHLHSYGDHREITFHIRLPGDMSIREGHGIATDIEKVMREKLGLEATIHVELWKGSPSAVAVTAVQTWQPPQ